MPALRRGLAALAAATVMALSSSGCTSLSDYLNNGLKVGPNYCPPPAPVADHWIDAADARVREEPADLSRWWAVFDDPKLDHLIQCAYRQNLSLREAGLRILQARAQLAIAQGNFFPQLQDAFGSYRRQGANGVFSDQWSFGFSLAWELDFWGRFRRAIAADDDLLEASIADYDDVLVTLLGDVAVNYVVVRTQQRRIELMQANVKLQKDVLAFIERRLGAGFRVTELDLDQAKSTLRQTEAAIPQLEIDLRLATNRLCILLGMPPADLQEMVGSASIPSAPPEVTVGIPAELLTRRPDIRRAERQAAAQAEQIGIAEADFYPIFTLSGTLGYQAQQFSRLFTSNAFNGSVGPSFQWNILNYGRILNNVRLQDARFQELVVLYQNAVLLAAEEVEDGLVTFLRAQERSRLLDESVKEAQKALNIVVLQYNKGAVDFNRYALIEQNLVQQQDLAAQARGQIAQGLIQVYRALGGGWQIRCPPQDVVAAMPAGFPPGDVKGPEELPVPLASPFALEEPPERAPAVPQSAPGQDDQPAVPEPDPR